ncbi:SWI/SNF and RSC complex subunit Ssr1 [Sparganum proliferum]
MLRSLLVILFAALALSDDVEIVDDEPIAPTVVEPETFDAEGEFKGAENMNALLSFVDPPLGFVRSTSPASIVAGKVCKFVVSLENSATTGSVHYSLYTLEAALHYPHYYGYHIQNFTSQMLQNTLEPGQQASLFYSFTPSVQLAGQHFDLAVILTYHDQSGRPYFHSLFNATIALLEDDEGMDTEIVFLTLLVLALTALVAFALWTWISSKALKRSNKVEPNRNIDGTSENKYLTPTKKVSPPNKPERADDSVKRRQGKKPHFSSNGLSL